MEEEDFAAPVALNDDISCLLLTESFYSQIDTLKGKRGVSLKKDTHSYKRIHLILTLADALFP